MKLFISRSKFLILLVPGFLLAIFIVIGVACLISSKNAVLQDCGLNKNLNTFSNEPSSLKPNCDKLNDTSDNKSESENNKTHQLNLEPCEAIPNIIKSQTTEHQETVFTPDLKLNTLDDILNFLTNSEFHSQEKIALNCINQLTEICLELKSLYKFSTDFVNRVAFQQYLSKNANILTLKINERIFLCGRFVNQCQKLLKLQDYPLLLVKNLDKKLDNPYFRITVTIKVVILHLTLKFDELINILNSDYSRFQKLNSVLHDIITILEFIEVKF